jgi:hypothetical protein
MARRRLSGRSSRRSTSLAFAAVLLPNRSWGANVALAIAVLVLGAGVYFGIRAFSPAYVRVHRLAHLAGRVHRCAVPTISNGYPKTIGSPDGLKTIENVTCGTPDELGEPLFEIATFRAHTQLAAGAALAARQRDASAQCVTSTELLVVELAPSEDRTFCRLAGASGPTGG